MSNQWFPEIEDEDGAKKLAKQGAISLCIFAAMNLLGGIFAIYASKGPMGNALAAQEVQYQVIWTLIIVPLLLIFAYRVYSGNGWLVSGLALIMFSIEAVLKAVSGATNIGWIIFYLALGGMMLNGIRACWWLRSGSREQELASNE